MTGQERDAVKMALIGAQYALFEVQEALLKVECAEDELLSVSQVLKDLFRENSEVRDDCRRKT